MYSLSIFMSFKIKQTESGMRIGELQTRHGCIKTPFFMPDATRASVRGLTNEQLKSVSVYPMVVNTYHLLLQPGMKLMRNAGGIHNFMNWDGPLLSDSGGYQVYSLIHKNAKLGKITEEGAVFKSILDGSRYLLTPEKAIQIQFDLGVDMMVLLDDPRPNYASELEIEDAVKRTIRWAIRCKVEFEKQILDRKLDENTRPLLFAVVQGGPFLHLREKCAKDLIKIGFDGYSFGGRHIDENGNFMKEIIAKTASFIPKDKPRFALGIGNPSDIVQCYKLGWDMFDCVVPTREGRHGRLFIMKSKKIKNKNNFYKTINIVNARFKNDFTSIDENCDCYACKNYTKGYLHHLFRVGEPLGAQMAALHNLKFYVELMDELKKIK
jgi:queuine tRNA-ribosyltransferase